MLDMTWSDGMRIAATFFVSCLAACSGQHAPPQASVEPIRVVDPVAIHHVSEEAVFEVTELVTGLERPWGLAFLPDGSMLVTERPGRMRLIPPSGPVSQPLRGLPKIFVSGQSGLLDVVISPDFEHDGLVYFSFAEPNFRGNFAGTAVARGRLGDGELEDVEVIYRQEPKVSSGTHVGSRLVFDGEGHLFVTQGDNRAAEEAQKLDRLAGKLVRIHVDGRVPDDNPFVGRKDARPEIWSYGHRNMQGAALHPDTGKLWISEHGPMGGDEINVPKAGGNYGWPLATHGRDYSGSPFPGSLGSQVDGTELPHYVWEVSPGLSGMLFYDGDAFPAWRGDLFLGALASSELIRLRIDGEKVAHEERLLSGRGQRIRDVRSGPDGALYLLVDADAGALLRVAPPAQ